jgi:transposase
MTATRYQRGAIMALHKRGVSYRDIVLSVEGINSKNTVTKIVRQELFLEQNPDATFERQRNLKTKKQVSLKRRRQLAKKLAKQQVKRPGGNIPKYGTCRRIGEGLQTKHRIKVSACTVRRDLRKEGMKPIVRKRVSGMNPEHVAARLLFIRTFKERYGRAYRQWPSRTDVFKKLIFSDEHWCTTNDSSSRIQWCSHRHDALARSSKARYNTKSIMIWAAIGYNYKSPIIVLNTTKKNEENKISRLNGESYHKLLVKSQVVSFCQENRYIFMQDGARPHIAEEVMNYFRNKNVVVMRNWPAHSPALNPIEKVWSHLNTLVSEHYPPARDTQELEAQVRWIWEHKMTQATINNFVLGFDKCCQECVALRGKY